LGRLTLGGGAGGRKKGRDRKRGLATILPDAAVLNR